METVQQAPYMNADFGTLVDFLRGELDEPAMAEVRARLENEAELFRLFERLRKTYAVLRSMPAIGPVQAVGRPEAIPLTTPRAEFVRDVRREFESRGWIGLLPSIVARPEYVSALRVEFSVRAICARLPMLVVSDSLLETLRLEFGARAKVFSLPFIKARPAWIAMLRRDFSARAVVSSLPMLEVRQEFVRSLREEFKQRALVGSLPHVEVREGFARRLKVALVETSREVAVAEKPMPVLPTVSASDPFRRRLFKSILISSHRRVRETPKRVDIDEYQWGREIKRGWNRGKRSVGFTMALHAVALALTLFIFARPDDSNAMPYLSAGKGASVVAPLEPSVRETGSRPPRENYKFPTIDSPDWSSANADLPLELNGETGPGREMTTREEPPVPRPELIQLGDEVLSAQIRDGGTSFFRLRGMPRAEKVDYLGSEELYEALDSALGWLARRQQQWDDGRWSFVDVEYVTRDPELRTVQELEITAASVLAFLGEGHSSAKSPLGYDYTVRRGIDWILKQQAPSGQIGPEGIGNVLVHAMATLALAEDFGLTRSQRLREPLRDACRWLCGVRAADAVRGTAGFPFLMGQNASLTTSVWAYMALATARNVKVPPIDLPQLRIDEFLEWYQDELMTGKPLADQNDVLAQSNLLPASAGATLSLFVHEKEYALPESARHLLGVINRDLPNLKPGVVDDPVNRPRTDRCDVRYLFFGSLAQSLNLQRNGKMSTEWYSAFAETLLANQSADGSWASSSHYNDRYGQAYSVAFAALSIENAYRVSILSK
ncbi:MAG: terpene cyclase/mutase family protein [Planctomycetes bacterium]|nr:terpene cyclase/mutase family protein [Planctomycetota bacterium]